MSDPIGTIRREDRENSGYSLWLHLLSWTGMSHWECIHSTDIGRIGCSWHTARDDEMTRIIGVVPDTPAAEQSEVRS